jgi:hypothetical protein
MIAKKRYLFSVLVFLLACVFSANAQSPVNPSGPAAPAGFRTIEPGSIVSAMLKFQKPVFRGSISSVSKKSVQLGHGTTMKLGKIAAMSFKPLDRYTTRLQRLAIPGRTILFKPVVHDEAVEFDDSFVLRKSTTVVVLDPAKMKQVSPGYKSFLNRQQIKTMSVAALDPESRKGLSDFMKHIDRLDPRNPLRLAAARGQQEVLNAILAGKGEFTIEDTIVVPKFIPKQLKGMTMYPSIRNGSLNFKALQPVRLPLLKQLGRVSGRHHAIQPGKIKMQHMAMAQQTGNKPKFTISGKKYFTAEFLAGFTRGHSWQWERKWKYPSGFFRATIGGGYGFGLRIPVRASGDLSPTRIYTFDKKDRSVDVHGRLKVDVLDADAAYFKRTGLPESELFRGNEVVLEYQLGFGYKFRALWTDVLYRPFSGTGLNYSQNARPPWGKGCANCGFHIPIPPEVTRTSLGYSALKGFVQTGFHVNGTGAVYFYFAPVRNNIAANPVRLKFENSNYHPFTIRLAPLALPGNQNMISENFGFRLNKMAYRMGLDITPEVRVGIQAGYKNFSRTFTTDWIELNMFRIGMGSVQLSTHKGTRHEFVFNQGIKTFRKMKTKNTNPIIKRIPRRIIN